MDGESVAFQIVKGLAANLSDAQIEHALSIAHSTQRTYMERLFHKFNTRTRGEIAAKALAALIENDK